MLVLRSVLLVLAASGLALLAYSGCGRVTLANACADRAVAACERLSRCQPNLLFEKFGDQTTCEQRFLLECQVDAAIIGHEYSPGDVESCAHELSSADCDAGGFGEAAGPACARILTTPSVRDGATCVVGLQCGGGICGPSRDPKSPGGCGQCALVSPTDGPCPAPPPGGFEVFCSYGQHCSAATGMCIDPLAEGRACGGTARFTCEQGLACHHGRCQALRLAGDACDSDTADLCDPFRELACDLAQGRCVEARPPMRKVGESCAATPAGTPICGPQAFCDPSTNTCTAEVPDGEACDGVGVNHCIFPAQCIDGTCSTLDPGTCG